MVFLSFIFLTTLLYGCDSTKGTSKTNQEKNSNPDQVSVSKSTFGDITTATVNGQTIQYYSAPFPLENISLTELKSRANRNDVEAIAELGRRYSAGIGVLQDIDKAKKLYSKAANSGDPTAQNELAGAYDYGLFGEENPQQAVYWYRNAAELGFAPAQYNIGHMLQYGRGVERNLSEALSFYKKAAKQNFPPAQSAIGVMYSEGIGVNKDYNEAIKWFEISAKSNFHIAQYNLGLFYEYGYGVNKNIIKAIYYYEKASEQGNEYAKINLGTIYLFGDSGKIDYKKAFSLFSSSARNGSKKFSSFFNLAQMYENGLYVKKNIPKSYAFYTSSLKLFEKCKDPESIMSREDILDSLNTLRTKMTQDQILAGEREITNVMREYGVTF